MTLELSPIRSAIHEMLEEIGIPLSIDAIAAEEEWAANVDWDCHEEKGA